LKVAEYCIFATQLRLCVTGLTFDVSEAGRTIGGCPLAVVYLPLKGEGELASYLSPGGGRGGRASGGRGWRRWHKRGIAGDQSLSFRGVGFCTVGRSVGGAVGAAAGDEDGAAVGVPFHEAFLGGLRDFGASDGGVVGGADVGVKGAEVVGADVGFNVGVFGKRLDGLGWSSGGGPGTVLACWLLSGGGLGAVFAKCWLRGGGL
jgi:hypothetical protein